MCPNFFRQEYTALQFYAFPHVKLQFTSMTQNIYMNLQCLTEMTQNNKSIIKMVLNLCYVDQLINYLLQL